MRGEDASDEDALVEWGAARRLRVRRARYALHDDAGKHLEFVVVA